MLYLTFGRLIAWMALLERSSASKDAELLVLRKEVSVLLRCLPTEPATPSEKDVVLSVLAEPDGHVPTALELLAERGLSVDRSYVYEIKRDTHGCPTDQGQRGRGRS